MARMMKRRTRSVRFFATWLTIALVAAIVAPGSVVLADEGESTDTGAAEKSVQEEVVVDTAEAEAPADDAPPADEAAAEEPAAGPASVEESVEAEPVTAAVVSASPSDIEDPFEPDDVPATSLGIKPTYVGGNPTCSVYDNFKLEGVAVNGTYTEPDDGPALPAGASITISSADDYSFSFSAVGVVIHSVIVKASNGANVYSYGASGVAADGTLWSVRNWNGQYHQISHITFCWSEAPEDTDIIAKKFNDEDSSGARNGEEAWMSGFAFKLYAGPDSDGPWEYLDEVTSDGDGMADFGAYGPGWYKLVEVLTADQSAAGWTPTNGDPLGEFVFEHSTEADSVKVFGNVIVEPPVGALVVHKFEDSAIENGSWDEAEGELTLSGWEFKLKNGEGAVIATGTTGADGMLAFSDLDPGDYVVEEVVKDGWYLTTDQNLGVTVSAEATANAWFGNHRNVYTKTFELTYPDKPVGVDLKVTFDLNGEPESLWLTGEGSVYSAEIDVPYPYEITNVVWWADGPDELVALGETAGETLEGDLTNEFEYDPYLSGHKFNDLSEDGVWDGDEPPIEDWTIFLYRVIPQDVELYATPPLIPGLEFVASTLTDVNGYYEFSGMLPGLYMVVEDLPEGWTQSVAPEGPFLVGHGTALEDLDFGNYEPFQPFTELDLAILKEADKTEADPGDTVTYTLTYWNNGELAATDFTITDEFDERYVGEVFDVSDGGVVDMVAGTITWTLAGPLSMEDGQKTLTYTVRLIEDMPEDETNVDNVVVIEHPRDSDPSNNTDDWRVVVDNPALPFTEEEPFLPFTGGSLAMLIGAAMASAGIGVALRRRRKDT